MEIIVEVFSETGQLPTYGTEFSSGVDLRAVEPVVIPAGESRLIHTGLYVAIPAGYELQIRSRSGLALKNGIVVGNSPGTIDSDYRNEIGIILHNHSKVDFGVSLGDRVAQAVLQEVPKIAWKIVPNKSHLSSTMRGQGGFGSTGVK